MPQEATGGSWVLVLRDAQYGGTWQSASGYEPLAHGTFSRFKAVYKSGFVTCNSGTRSDYRWQECSGNAPAFELKQNGNFVVQQPSWSVLPAECRLPSTTTGDIVCVKLLTLRAGDKLTPTWYEASRQTSTSDNDGTMTIDLYGYATVSQTQHVKAECLCAGAQEGMHACMFVCAPILWVAVLRAYT